MSEYGQGFDGSTRFSGSCGFRYRAVSAAYTVSKEEDYFIDADGSGGSFSVTLPPAASCFSDECGMVFLIRNAGATGTITIDGDGAETIDGSATQALSSQYATILVQSDGTGWVTHSSLTVASAASLSLSGTLGVTGATTLTSLTTSAAVDLSASSVTLGTVLGTVDLSGGTLDASGGLTLAAGEVDSADVANGAIDPVHLATNGFASIAADGAVTLAATHQVIELVGSTTGAKAATMTATHTGHRIRITLAAASGGSYTFACDYPTGTSGTATLDAAGEGLQLAYSGTAWIATELIGGATFA